MAENRLIKVFRLVKHNSKGYTPTKIYAAISSEKPDVRTF